MNKHIDIRPRNNSHRGVAPVIATLLLVAIAVVGGAIVFAYSQNFFSSSQISGRPTIEAVKIMGYDARDVMHIHDQNGVLFNGTASGGTPNAQKQISENVAIYVKNDSVQSVTISELRFGGATYDFETATIADLSALNAGRYTIAGVGGGTGIHRITSSAVAEVQPGQTVSIVLSLGEDMKMGRDTQFKMTTTNGAVFVGTVVIGQQSG